MIEMERPNNIPILPYSKIVGQQNLKMALEIAYIAGEKLGGVLISGHRGTGKSTTVRSFAKMMYEELPVTLPINATEDRVVGGYKIDALMKGNPEPQNGLLKDADGKILYIDEVNLLDDHIVNIILDTAASGHLSVQRQGINIPDTETRFILVGTMNPEEGHLRPQLLDRFGLMVHVITNPEYRADILRTVLAFDTAFNTNSDTNFLKTGRQADDKIKRKLVKAREKQNSVTISEEIAEQCIKLAGEFSAIGHRADFFTAMAARAQAARQGAEKVKPEHLREVTPLVLTHRRMDQSGHWFKADNERTAGILSLEAMSDLNLSKKET